MEVDLEELKWYAENCRYPYQKDYNNRLALCITFKGMYQVFERDVLILETNSAKEAADKYNTLVVRS